MVSCILCTNRLSLAYFVGKDVRKLLEHLQKFPKFGNVIGIFSKLRKLRKYTNPLGVLVNLSFS